MCQSKVTIPPVLFSFLSSSVFLLRPLVANDLTARDLVKRLLEKDPHKRLSVKQAMAHPYFTVNLSLPLFFISIPLLLLHWPCSH